MPELPEIETVKRVVGPQVVGRTIVSVRAADNGILANATPESLSGTLTGRRFASAGRRGKALILADDLGGRMVIRFGMTGQLYVCPQGTEEEKHTHGILSLDDGTELRYVDPRRFGRIWYFRHGEADTSGIENMGIEPGDAGLDPSYLGARFERRGTTVKEGLLDQSVVAGIGNIWSDEILFEAGICPLTPCKELTLEQLERLAHAIPEKISFAVENNAVSNEDYLAGKSRKYYDMSPLKVYGRSGKACSKCGTALVRNTVGGRSTCWCPMCQRFRFDGNGTSVTATPGRMEATCRPNRGHESDSGWGGTGPLFI